MGLSAHFKWSRQHWLFVVNRNAPSFLLPLLLPLPPFPYLLLLPTPLLHVTIGLFLSEGLGDLCGWHARLSRGDSHWEIWTGPPLVFSDTSASSWPLLWWLWFPNPAAIPQVEEVLLILVKWDRAGRVSLSPLQNLRTLPDWNLHSKLCSQPLSAPLQCGPLTTLSVFKGFKDSISTEHSNTPTPQALIHYTSATSTYKHKPFLKLGNFSDSVEFRGTPEL